MKRHEKKTVTNTYDVMVEVKCDLCGKTSKSENWTDETFYVKEVTVQLREGSSFPEGGSGTETEFDICPDCFKSKLIPWVESQGGKAREKDYSF